MKSGFKLQNYKITKLQHPQSGYILLTLMLIVALMSIAALAVLPAIKQQIQRDREEELMHRGTQYMRAIQHFYKKTGRYPTRIEELENTNNIRFLRKRYKDPMSRDPKTHKEKDFRFLHMQDINLYTGGTTQGFGQNLGQPPGQNPRGGTPPVMGGGATQSTFGTQPGGLPQAGSTGTNQSGSSQSDSGDSNSGGSEGETPNSGTSQSNQAGNAGGQLGSNPAGGNNPLVFGGGPILGVASTSKEQSIREFGDQYKHYKDWLFIYDPSDDMGGLLQGPVVPTPGGTRGGKLGMPAGAMATQSQGTAGGTQPQAPSPVQQGPQTPQMPPEEQ